MAFSRGIDGPDPTRAQPICARAGAHEDWRADREWKLADGTLACPRCDAPVALGGSTVALTQRLDCPFCLHSAAVREFLSLAAPARPARVTVRMFHRARAAR